MVRTRRLGGSHVNPWRHANGWLVLRVLGLALIIRGSSQLQPQHKIESVCDLRPTVLPGWSQCGYYSYGFSDTILL